MDEMSHEWRAIALVIGAVGAFLSALVCALYSYLFHIPPSSSSALRCCVCLEAAPDILILDCGHMATCRNCMGLGPLDCRTELIPQMCELQIDDS